MVVSAEKVEVHTLTEHVTNTRDQNSAISMKQNDDYQTGRARVIYNTPRHTGDVAQGVRDLLDDVGVETPPEPGLGRGQGDLRPGVPQPQVDLAEVAGTQRL